LQESDFATLPAASLNDRWQTEHLFATFIVFGGDDIIKNNRKKNRKKILNRLLVGEKIKIFIHYILFHQRREKIKIFIHYILFHQRRGKKATTTNSQQKTQQHMGDYSIRAVR